MRSTYSQILNRIMTSLDLVKRHDLSDEIEKRINTNYTSSEIHGEVGLFLIEIKKNEYKIFEIIKTDYYEYFKSLNDQGMFIGINF